MDQQFIEIPLPSLSSTPTTAIITSPPVSPKTPSPTRRKQPPHPSSPPQPFDCGGDPEICTYIPLDIRSTYKNDWKTLEGHHQVHCPITKRLSENVPRSPGRRGAVGGGDISLLQSLGEGRNTEYNCGKKRKLDDLSTIGLEEGEIEEGIEEGEIVEDKRKRVRYSRSPDGDDKKENREIKDDSEGKSYQRKKVQYGSSLIDDGKENKKVAHEFAKDVAEQVIEDLQVISKVEQWIEGVIKVNASSQTNRSTKERASITAESKPIIIQATREDFEDFAAFLEKNDICPLTEKHGFVVIKSDPSWLVNHPRNAKRMRDLLQYKNPGCVQVSEQQVSRMELETEEKIFKVVNMKKSPSKGKRSNLMTLEKFLDKAEKIEVAVEGGLDEMCVDIEEKMENEELKTIYGQDCEASIILPKLKLPQASLSYLSGNELQNLQTAIGGLSTDYAYVGTGGSVFAMHIEDWNLHSMNIHLWGAPKVWYFIAPSDRKKVEAAIAKAIGYEGFECTQFVRHEAMFLSEEFLKENGVEYTKYQQDTGDLLFISPWAYHQGFNSGMNIAVANNYGSAELRKEGYFEVDGGKYVNCINGECKLICKPMELHFNKD